MRQSTTRLLPALCLIAGLPLLSACGGGGDSNGGGSTTATPPGSSTQTPAPVPATPSITSFSPKSAPPGKTVMINGANFSGTNANNVVTLAGIRATQVKLVITGTGTVTSGTLPNALEVTVPEGSGSGPVVVVVNGQTLTAPGGDFTFEPPAPPPPQIGSIDPLRERPGERLTIHGANFSTTPDENLVKINGVTAEVVEATDTRLTVTVPNGSGSGKVTVTVADDMATSSQTFTYLAAGSEPAPSAPEPGSTADVGNPWEGIYKASSVFGAGYVFITHDGQLSFYNATSVFSEWLVGSIAVSDDVNWNLVGVTYEGTFGGGPVTGSGEFTPRTSLSGSYVLSSGTGSKNLSADYSSANSLAVTPASLAGRWTSVTTNGGMTFEFDQNGAVISGSTSGTSLGTCALTATLEQSEPGTNKNMFSLTMTAQNVATGLATPCKLGTTSAYNGLAAIVLERVGTQEADGYFRTLAFNAVSDSNMITYYLRKEP